LRLQAERQQALEVWEVSVMANLAALGGNPVAPEGLKVVWPEFGEEEHRRFRESLNEASGGGSVFQRRKAKSLSLKRSGLITTMLVTASPYATGQLP